MANQGVRPMTVGQIEVDDAHHPFKYYDLIMALFVTVILCSNLIGPAKACELTLPLIGTVSFGAGILFFPMSYLFSDFLTEVYGYARARKVVWAGFGAQIFASVMAWVVVTLPPAAAWPNQAAYETVFGITWRIVGASMLAYSCGSFCNNYVLAKMKLWTQGRYLFARTIGSTIIGELVDSLIFYPLAFLGAWDLKLLITVLFTNYVLKVLWEVIATPVTYRVVAALKRAEGVDFYDRNTNFTPFSIELEDDIKK